MIVAALGLLIATGCSSSPSPSTSQGSGSVAPLQIADPAISLQRKGANTLLFGTITNTGSSPVTIVGGSTPVASSVIVADTVVVSGEASESPMPSGLTIEPGQPYKLSVSKTHIAILELNTEMDLGQKVQMTLKTSDGAVAAFEATVTK